ncbi:MAG: bifunctional 5,10-methylenetetrahydrofolate dehydrogenase/5,10-methenyltetrahydrofolate cyclohydrolase [Clostridiales Family XIII bacterium]|jgi:methylenetetrahydrofolate dehydrogenase (NADP+)/methenyltetrahydrofolate cyclohydrolase|nr:bifunctional 5,10-methylenetetrahydrofolate dehydrogenase/5,10-methenyltetrahydrofolate cyclohydrolase [Clostridiales Family XIII bacterium]
MGGVILYGKNVADAMENELRDDAAALARRGVTPTLAIIRIGERGGDMAYERGAMKRCDLIGVNVRRFVLPPDVLESELLGVTDKINRDDEIHGCLIFRPLPKGINESRICNSLAPEKDVDGITEESLYGVFTGFGHGYPPCTAQACIEILTHYGIDIAGKKAVVIGRSLVIGKPVAMMLLGKNATVTICHSKTEDPAEQCRAADIVVVAAGRAGLADARFINPGGVVIDVGVNVDDNGHICGDVRKEDAERAKAYSPVPGGVGAVTTSVLVKHVIDAARKAQPDTPGRP